MRTYLFLSFCLYALLGHAQDGLENRNILRQTSVERIRLVHQQARYAVIENDHEKAAIRPGDKIGQQGYTFITTSPKGLWLKSISGYVLLGAGKDKSQPKIQYINPTEIPEWLKQTEADLKAEDDQNQQKQ